jgi:hypothetical protein
LDGSKSQAYITTSAGVAKNVTNDLAQLVQSVAGKTGEVTIDVGDLTQSGATDLQVMTWNQSSGEWEPQDSAGGGGNPFDQDLNTTDAPTFTDLALTNGTTPTSFTLTNTDDGAGNSETGYMRWVANTLEIGAEATGTGVVRGIAFRGGASLGAYGIGAGEVGALFDTSLGFIFTNTIGNISCQINATTGEFIGSNVSTATIRSAGGTLAITISGPNAVFSNSILASGTVTKGNYTFATLPTPASGMTCFVSDASVVHAGNSGTIVAGGGANFVPVYYDGTNWRIS